MSNTQYNNSILGLCQCLSFGITTATDDHKVAYDIITNMAYLRYKRLKPRLRFIRTAFLQLDNNKMKYQCLIKILTKYAYVYSEGSAEKRIEHYKQCLSKSLTR